MSELFQLRKPCHKCEGTDGVIREKGSQDCVYCSKCDAWQYNAPRAETGKPVRHIKTRDVLPPKQRARILIVRANGRCEICGSGGRVDQPLHVGHLISVDAGRSMGLSDDDLNSDENLAAMCAVCNLGLGSEPVTLRLATRILMARRRFDADRERKRRAS